MRMCPNCAKPTVYYEVKRRAYVCFEKDCGYCRTDVGVLGANENEGKGTSVDGPVCPRCGGKRYEVTNGLRIDRYCFRCGGRAAYQEIIYTDMPKPRVVIEVKDGSLLSVYSDLDAEFILIDHNDDGCVSSAVIIPDKIAELPEKTRAMAEDAVRRSQP